MCVIMFFFFFSSKRRHTSFDCDWSSDVCFSDPLKPLAPYERVVRDSIEADPFQRRLRAVDVAAAAEIDAVMADMAPERFVNLTHMFDEDTATVFIDDLGHATEQANGEVAARMLGPLLGQLACAPARQGLAPRRSCK